MLWWREQGKSNDLGEDFKRPRAWQHQAPPEEGRKVRLKHKVWFQSTAPMLLVWNMGKGHRPMNGRGRPAGGRAASYMTMGIWSLLLLGPQSAGTQAFSLQARAWRICCWTINQDKRADKDAHRAGVLMPSASPTAQYRPSQHHFQSAAMPNAPPGNTSKRPNITRHFEERLKHERWNTKINTREVTAVESRPSRKNFFNDHLSEN